MKPGCSKCFKEAVKVGNEYICPACGEMVAQIPTALSVEEENQLLKRVIESYMRIEHDLAEDCERFLEQRDKLIEWLRSLYQKIDAEHTEAHEKGDFDTADILGELCEAVRDILKAVGVMVGATEAPNER